MIILISDACIRLVPIFFIYQHSATQHITLFTQALYSTLNSLKFCQPARILAITAIFSYVLYN